jgi:hypothetical protein
MFKSINKGTYKYEIPVKPIEPIDYTKHTIDELLDAVRCKCIHQELTSRKRRCSFTLMK